jgi:Lysophospholipase catalytic domain
MPNTSSSDPNFGRCMQCAAIDRARYKVDPPLSRSSFCTQCFQQYCFDPNNLTNSSELPGRKLQLVEPGTGGLSLVLQFLSRNKVPIILGFIGLFIGIAVLCVFLCVCFGEFLRVCVDSDMVRRIRRERRAREAKYESVELNSDEEAPFLRHERKRDTPASLPPYEP